MNLKKELVQFRYEFGVHEQIDCTEEQNAQYRQLAKENKPLPARVYCRNSDPTAEYATFYSVSEMELTPEQLNEYLQYKQLKTLTSIKKCMVFFTVLTVISIIGGVIAAFAALA